MAKGSDHLAGGFEDENTGGVLSGLLADEDVLDRRALWRLGSWGAAAVGAVVLAVYANQSLIGSRRDQIAAADLARQAQQIQSVAKESQNETRRLASAIDTLSGDRDRLYSRVTVLEQGLDSVTGAIARQSAAPAAASAVPAAAATSAPQVAQNPALAPVAAPVATTAAAAAAGTGTSEKPRPEAAAPEQPRVPIASAAPATPAAPVPAPAPLMASKSMMAPPDAAAAKLIEPNAPANAMAAVPKPEVVASAPAADEPEAEVSQPASPKVAVQRTEFGIDVGGANSVNGLRALWRGLLKSRSNAPLAALRPIIVVKESSTGLGMQLRLVAGPLSDAAAAAKICAVLIENDRSCETTVFDGQRLAMKADEQPTAAATKPAIVRPAARRRGVSKRAENDETAKKPDAPSTLSTLFRR
jgi:hypothetical protein